MLIQHSAHGGGGTIVDWASARGIDVDRVVLVPDFERPSEAAELPPLDRYDLVVSMGGRWSVYDDDIIGSWMSRELDLLREAADREVPVFGVCFGAQAMAAALGGEVKPATVPERGWQNIDTDLPDQISPGPWMQWHGDTFTLPPGATELARSEVGPQVYRVGPSVGVQFHPEVNRHLLDQWLAYGKLGLDGLGVDEAELRAETERQDAGARERAGRLLDWFLDDVSGLS